MPREWDAQGNLITPPKREWDAAGNLITEPQYKSAASLNEPIAAQPSGFMESAKKFASGFWEMTNPVPALAQLYERGPIQTVIDVAGANVDEFSKGQQAYKEGRYSEAIGHTMAGLLPLLGPAAAHAGETIGSGEIAKGSGEAAAILTPFAAKALPATKISPAFKNRNLVEAAAVEYGQRAGIPVDVPTATGKRFFRGLQAGSERTPVAGILGLGEKARESMAKALTKESGKLASRASSAPQTPEMVGASTTKALEAKSAGFASKASVQYGKLRDIENSPANLREVATGTKTIARQVPTEAIDAAGNPVMQTVKETVPATEKMALPVDMRSVKESLRPIYEEMKQRMPLAQQQASPGLRAIENMVNGKDYVPASVADGNLGALKGISREALAPGIRNISQGLAAKAITELGDAVKETVVSAGPEAEQALLRGRLLTRGKWAAADILKELREEPVQAFQQMTWANDAGIENLRQIAKFAPQEMPKVGRAWLEKGFGKATAEGGFGRNQGLWADWQKLGPETKKILFKDFRLRSDLDSFFLLQKKLAENPNPSGTAYVGTALGSAFLVFAEPATGISVGLGGAALTKILYSPSAARMLTRGMKLSLGKGVSASLGASLILNAARKAGVQSRDLTP